MRNKSSNVQVTKKRLSKCEGVFRSYSDIQLRYATLHNFANCFLDKRVYSK